MKSGSKLYVVGALKDGETFKNSYIVGVFTQIGMAIRCANNHNKDRGGKYACVVSKCSLNSYSQKSNVFTIEVY